MGLGFKEKPRSKNFRDTAFKLKSRFVIFFFFTAHRDLGFLLHYLYCNTVWICRPSDRTVGRPRTKIGTRDGRSKGRDTDYQTTTPPLRPPHLLQALDHRNSFKTTTQHVSEMNSIQFCRFSQGISCYWDYCDAGPGLDLKSGPDLSPRNH